MATSWDYQDRYEGGTTSVYDDAAVTYDMASKTYDGKTITSWTFQEES